MKLYYMPGACSTAPHVALEWTGRPYETVRLEHEQLHRPDYLEINPLGKVPAFYADDGTGMVEASAILLYLVEKFPEADLGYGSTPEERYHLHRWLSHFSSNVHPAFGPLFAPQRYVTRAEFHADAQEAARGRVRDALGFLDARMEGRDHVLGGKRTVLDAYLLVFCRWGKSMLPDGLQKFRHLERFLRRMGADPGVQSVMRQQGIEL